MTNFSDLKRRVLKKRLRVLYEEYEATVDQLMSTTSPVDKSKLKENIRVLEEQVQDLEKECRDEEIFLEARGLASESASDSIRRKRKNDDYDVFLSYSPNNRDEVEEIAEGLLERGILPWLDQWELKPGMAWSDVLFRALEKVKAVAVFIGNDEISPWQESEMRAFFRNSVRKGLPVIPIILKTVVSVPKLPIFLEDRQWVDFRQDSDAALSQLIWGITGTKTSL